MIDLNKYAMEVTKISRKRELLNQYKCNTSDVLKHCSGEVIEAFEAWTNWFYTGNEFTNLLECPKNQKLYKQKIKERKEDFELELGDIIVCALICAHIEGLDVEAMLTKTLKKNKAKVKNAKTTATSNSNK